MLLLLLRLTLVRSSRRRSARTTSGRVSTVVGLIVFARLDARVQIVQPRRVVAYLLGERVPALRRQIDVGQRSLPPPGSSAWSTELVGGVLDAHAIDVILGGRFAVPEAQNRRTDVCLCNLQRYEACFYSFATPQGRVKWRA